MSSIKLAARYVYLLLTKHINDKNYLKFYYRIKYGEKLNLNPPVLFTEKMQWLKIYNQKPEYTMMVDKLNAKEYVRNKLGEQYVTPLLGVWNHFDEIEFDKLPDKFVLKCTHDCGGLVICQDKSKLDMQAAKEKIEKSLKYNWYYMRREWPYKDVKPLIIAEEYMENDSQNGLFDYKVWCFNGKPTYIQFISGRLGKKTYEGFYDTDWNLQDFSYHNPKTETPVQRPEKLEELLSLCEKLAEGIPFVRTDFYILPDNSIRFGEITFFPMSGMDHFKPESANKMLGDMIHL